MLDIVHVLSICVCGIVSLIDYKEEVELVRCIERVLLPLPALRLNNDNSVNIVLTKRANGNFLNNKSVLF